MMAHRESIAVRYFSVLLVVGLDLIPATTFDPLSIELGVSSDL